MAKSPLAINWFSQNRDTPTGNVKDENIVLPEQKAFFEFTNPPQEATEVVVEVKEQVKFLSKRASRTRVIGTVEGEIRGGRFNVTSATFSRSLPDMPRDRTLVFIESPTAPGLGASVFLPEAEEVLQHTLSVSVRGRVRGRLETFQGDQRMFIEYPMAMVVPIPPTPQDTSLEVVESWSQQWKRHKPKLRHVERVRALQLARAIRPSDYDELIAALKKAAEKATNGVVALAVGHGDEGDAHGLIPWLNIVPENFPPPTEGRPFRYRLDIDNAVLRDGLGTLPGSNIKVVPQGPTRVKLDALDRLADALTAVRTRRLLLHTCSAGASQEFMQRLADRLRVPVMAHTEEIAYTGARGSGDIASHYDSEQPVKPRDLRHWPISKLSRPFRPGKKPPRFGPGP